MSDPVPEAPLALITDTDRRGVIVVVSAVTLAFSLSCYFTRVYVRLRVSGPWSHDDSTLSAATLVGLFQAVVIFLQVHQGFGVSREFLSDQDIARIGRLTYAADFLYLIALSLAKCSAVALIMRIITYRPHLLVSWVILAASTAWVLSSILVITIRCSPAAPLANLLSQCSGLFARWQYICAFDIITEVTIFANSAYLVAGLKMPTRMKAMVVLAFALRIPVIAAAAVRLHYLHREILSPDPTLAGVSAAVWTQVELNYSLMATAAASLGSFIQPFSKAYLANSEYDRLGSNQRAAGVGHSLNNISSSCYIKGDQSSKGEQTLATQSLTGHPQYQPDQRLRPDPVSHDVMVSSNNPQSLDNP